MTRDALEEGVRARDEPVINEVIARLDDGRLRVCEPLDGRWVTHAWIKEAILQYFTLRTTVPMGGHDVAYFDKIPLKTNYASSGARCVPPGVARYGSYLGRGVILMPG